MTVTTIGSREARTKWRDLLDNMLAGTADVVIERHGQPVAAMIPYADFEALQDELDDLRAGRRAAEAYEEWKGDPATGRPYSEIRTELAAEGLLSE